MLGILKRLLNFNTIENSKDTLEQKLGLLLKETLLEINCLRQFALHLFHKEDFGRLVEGIVHIYHRGGRNDIYFCKEFADILTDDEIKFILAHELGHAAGKVSEVEADRFAMKFYDVLIGISALEKIKIFRGAFSPEEHDHYKIRMQELYSH